jgi:acyl carrier protein
MNKLYEGLAEIFEVDPDELTAATLLTEHGWDSLAIVSTIALVDELYSKEVDIKSLTQCETIGDLEKLADN